MMTNLLFNQANALGKRLAMVLTMLLMLGVTQVWGEDVTFIANQDKGSTTNTSADSMTKSGITISSTSAGLAYDKYRFYNGTITISSNVGNITKIVFTCTSTDYATVLQESTVSTGSLSINSSTVTWTGSSSSFTIKNTAQTRVSKIVLTTASLQEHTVKFFSGGEEVSSKNILSGSTIGTLPSATSCDLTNFPHFVGWTESIIDGTTTTKPTIITTSTPISSNKVYHAVFADKEESTGSGTTGSTTFAPKGSSKSSPWRDNGSTWTFSNITFANSTSAGFPQNGTATVTLPTGAVANTITITRTSNSWSGKISLLVKTGSTTIQTLTQPSTTTTINLTSANQKNTYTFSHNNAATNVAYVDNIKVNYTIPATPTTVTYITTCSTEPSVCTITYDANEGEGTITDEKEYTNGETVTVKGNFGKLTKDGYAFTGWNTEADGSGDSYKHNDQFAITANTTLYAQWCEAYWKLVTDATELENDTRIVIAAKDYNFALSTTQNDANRGQAAITKKYNTITFGADVQTLSLVGLQDNKFALYTGSGYLYAASKSANELKTKEGFDLNGNSDWSIAISQGVATILAQGTYTNNQLKYNAGSDLFSCYGEDNSQKDVVIYKEVCVQGQYNVTSNLTNATANTNPTTVASNATSLTLNYSANTGYLLPETITVKMGGVALSNTDDYTWDKETGKVWIVPADGFTGDIVVTINGWQQLATPTELNVTNITSTSATLSWNEVKNAKNYAIIIKKGDEKVKDITTAGTRREVTGLDANTMYTGCVHAVADGYTNSEETCVTFTTAPAAKVVNWNVKGTEHQTNFNGQSTAIYQPTDEELTCGEKKFVGWTATENYENATDAPNDLFTTTLQDGVTEGTTFYAVYADTRTTTSITYTWDMVKQSTTPALAAGDQIVIAAKDDDYALSTTQNTDTRGAVAVTKNSNSITINNNVQIFTIENGNEENTFALATGNGYLSGTRRKAGRNYYEQLNTATSKASANASWYIGFTEETTPYIYNEVSEKSGRNYEYPNYYVGFNYDYDWWESEYTYYFEAVRDASTWYDYNPENISIYRKTQHTTTTTVNSGYTTDCGCTPPQTPLNIENSTVVVNQTLDLSTITYTGGTGGRISQYYCSDATHTTIAEGHIFSANALGTYEITATQEANNGACETTATFTVTVTCATPSITPPTYETTINTPVDLKSVIKSTSTMPLTFACTDENVYISGTNFTFLAAGDYTITATQEAGGIYCNGSKEITITVTDPCAGKTKPSVNATAEETTITVTYNANGATTYRVYNNTTGDSDETTATSYTFSGLNPSTEYSWTVEAVYSDGCTAATSGTTTTSTPMVKYDVNWNVAGSGYNTGTPTTSVNHGEKVSDLPTAPDPAEHSCGDKVFVGWSKSQFVDGTRPADLFTDVAGSPVITAATTFYAVFADCVTGGDTPEDDTQGEWTLVTDVNDLQAGDKIIIACYSKEKAASDLTSAILSVDADVTFSNSGNTLTPSAGTLIFTLGGSTGAWTFANSSGQLLGATAVKKLAWDGGTTTWRISISDNNATIQNGTDGYGRFLYNVGSPRFTTYTSSTSESMLLPQIYKKTGNGSGSGETPEPVYTVTLSVLGETSEENTTSNYTLPIDVDAVCVGKTFVGWTTTANLSSSTEPTSDYWAKGTPVTITEDKTYYAVFATESTGGGEGVEQTMIFSEYFEDGEEAITYAYVAGEGDEKVAVEFDCGTNENNCPKYYDNGAAVRMYKENNIVVYHRNETLPLTKIQFTFTSTTYNKLSLDDTGVYDSETCTWIGSQTAVWFTATDGARIQSVTITIGGGTTYSNFSTTCDGGGETPNPDPGTEYVKVTSSLDDYSGEYLIVYEDGNVAFNGGLTTLDAIKNTISVTISNNAIAATDATNAAKFTIAKIDGGYSIQSASGKYIGRTTNSNGFNESATEVYCNTITYNNGITITSSANPILRYNNASDQNRFRYYASGQKSIALYKLTSTPALAPARKVAMKRDAAKATKKAGIARPITRITPTARGAQECASYENYTTICCASPITDLKYSAGANSITLYWTTIATSVTATLYYDEACTSAVVGATQSGITTGTCTFTGLEKTTTYYAKLTTPDGCVSVLEVSTERPNVSVAEWAANQINIDINTNEPIVVVLENEVTSGSQTGTQATQLFFSKYYEATGNVKLVAVYNGTANEIDLADYKIKYGKTSWAADYISLKDFGVTKGKIASGEEIILYTMNRGDSRDVAILDCVNADYPDGTWTEVTTANNTGKGSLSFAGDKTLALFNGNTMIDIIGGGTTSAPDNSGANTKPAWGDAKGWTCDKGLSIEDGTMIGISTNRCLLVRNNTVTSGDNAVASNTTDFATLCTEWKGAHVPDDDIDDGVAASCENFAFVGTFDYSDYYVQYEELSTSEQLPTEGRLADGTYNVTTPDLHDIACTNMRISIKDAGGNTLVTQDLKVPIIIDQDVQTDNQIYFKFTQRDNADTPPTNLDGKNENILSPEVCADCDIVIRDNKTLTHVATGTSEFHDMSVYPGAKFNNSSSEEFYLNSLQMHAKNDEVSYAIINNDGSTIDVGDMVFVKRMDDKYWYQFSLPYDCNISDIRQLNGQSMGKYWVDWGIKEYNGKRRQAEGTAAEAGQVSRYWEKVEETATLKAHHGYIIGLFTIEWTNQMKFVYFTPATSNLYHESGNDAKTTQVESWYTNNLSTVAPRHHGWNFTGSPYISIFNPQTPPYYGESSVLMSGTFDPVNPDGEYSSGDVYLSIPVLPDGLYYNQVLASSTSLMPFRAYFVQTVDPASADEQHTLTYAKNGRQLSPASAPARAAATKQRVLAELNITAPDGQTDNTGVWVDERYTTDYEITADLTKMYVAGTKPQLYTLAANNEKLAYNALPDDAATNVPIELYAPLAGDYTLTLNDRVSRIAGAESIELLHDGQVVANLLIQDYTITANKGTVSGYSLSIRRRADVSTAVDNTTGSTITLIANDEYISLVGVPTDATISIYDMLGRLITSQQANGQSVVNLSIVPQGVYNIVVANGTGYTTIKSVIK